MPTHGATDECALSTGDGPSVQAVLPQAHAQRSHRAMPAPVPHDATPGIIPEDPAHAMQKRRAPPSRAHATITARTSSTSVGSSESTAHD